MNDSSHRCGLRPDEDVIRRAEIQRSVAQWENMQTAGPGPVGGANQLPDRSGRILGQDQGDADTGEESRDATRQLRVGIEQVLSEHSSGKKAYRSAYPLRIAQLNCVSGTIANK